MIIEAAQHTITSIVNTYCEHGDKLIQKIPLDKKQCVSLSTAAALTLIAWKIYKRSNHKNKHIDPALLPPKVKGGYPVFGNMFELQKDPVKFLDEARDTLGPCFRVKVLGHGDVVVVTGPLIQEVMKSKNFSFSEGVEKLVPSERVVKLSYQHKFVAETISPREKNPVIYPIKHNFKEEKIGVFSERIQTALNIGFDSLLDIKQGEQRVVNTWDTFTELISHISCACFAGSNVGYNKDLVTGMATFTQKIIRAGLVLTTLPEWLGNMMVRRYLSVEHEMDLIMSLLVPELQKIRDGQPQEEVTYSAMALNLPKGDGSQRTVQDAAYHFNTIALASIHTTSQFTTFALHELSCRPALIQDLRNELATIENNRTPESVAKLPLMESFFREVLRHNMNYMGLHHLALCDTTLSTGQVIPKDTLVLSAIDQIHRNERFLPIDEDTGEACRGDTPLDQFDAYRFYGKNIKSTTSGLEYLAFGLGAHACPGRFFAVTEIKYVIAEIILRFNITTKSGTRAKDNVRLGMTRFPPVEPLIFEGL